MKYLLLSLLLISACIGQKRRAELSSLPDIDDNSVKEDPILRRAKQKSQKNAEKQKSEIERLKD